jgi:hypothetical protein
MLQSIYFFLFVVLSFLSIYFSQVHNGPCIFTLVMTTDCKSINYFKKPYILAGFEPGIFCSIGGRDHHYATPQGHPAFLFSKLIHGFFL